MISTAESDSGVDGHSLPEDEVIAPGTVIGERYRVLNLIGCGGMGSVYLAENLRAGGTVAIKVLRFEWSRNPALARRFRNEAKLTNYAEHPNIVKVLDCAELPDGRFYLVMEFVTGTTLAAELGDHGAMPVGRACRIARAIACAINASHANDVVHRDLKTENVMLTRYDGDDAEFVKVVDFGVSALLQDSDAASRLTRPGQSVGTPEYMAPEQAMGKPPSVAFDIYALGVLVFEMLTGDPPFYGGGAIEIMARKAMEPAPSLIGRREDIPLQLAFLVDDCLQRDPAKRPATAGEFLRRIDEILRTVGREEAAGYGLRGKPNGVDTTYSMSNRPAIKPAAKPSTPAAGRSAPRLDLRPIERDHTPPGGSAASSATRRRQPVAATLTGEESSSTSTADSDTDGVIQERRDRRRPMAHRPRGAEPPPAYGESSSELATEEPSGPTEPYPPAASRTDERPSTVVEAIEVEYEREPSGAVRSAEASRSRLRGMLARRNPSIPGLPTWGGRVDGLSVRQATDSEAYRVAAVTRQRRRRAVSQTITLALAAVGVVALVGLVAGRPLLRNDAEMVAANDQVLAAHSQDRASARPSVAAAATATAAAAVAIDSKPATEAGSAPPDPAPAQAGPSAVASATPAATGPTTALGSAEANETDEEPAKSTSKTRRRSMADSVQCAERRDAAEAARKAHDWNELVDLTRSAVCWKRRSERTALRTEALFQLSRFEECIRAGRGSKHATTAKFVGLCQVRSERNDGG